MVLVFSGSGEDAARGECARLHEGGVIAGDGGEGEGNGQFTAIRYGVVGNE